MSAATTHSFSDFKEVVEAWSKIEEKSNMDKLIDLGISRERDPKF